MIEAIEFRNAMARMTTAVNVVTTQGVAGAHGFTASAVCSVTDTPPTLLVCMNQSSRSHASFVENQVLCVNVLAAEQQPISNVFASKLPSNERFQHGNWTQLVTGSPVFTDALASFDCEIEQINPVGTHSIFLCRVVAIKYNEPTESLVYFNRAYHQVK
mgnify:FL=1